MVTADQLHLDDIVVSRTANGYDLLIVTRMPQERLSVVYRGDGWNLQYAVARGARIASSKGGDLWYTFDKAETLEYLETFRAGRSLAAADAVA